MGSAGTERSPDGFGIEGVLGSGGSGTGTGSGVAAGSAGDGLGSGAGVGSGEGESGYVMVAGVDGRGVLGFFFLRLGWTLGARFGRF